MLTASRLQRVLFAPLALVQDFCITSKVDVRKCDVGQALTIVLVVVRIHEGFDLGFKIAWQEVVCEQDAVF